jgi:Carboxypeptidase regulatory-like domain
MITKNILLASVVLILAPGLAWAQLSSENFTVVGEAIATQGTSLSGTSTSFSSELEAGGLYIYDVPAVPPPVVISPPGNSNGNSGTRAKSTAKTPAIVTPSVQSESPTFEPTVIPPVQKPIVVCNAKSAYTEVTTVLNNNTSIKATLPQGSVRSRANEAKGIREYSLLLKIFPIVDARRDFLTQKFTDLLVNFSKNDEGNNLPPGIAKKINAPAYQPPISEDLPQAQGILKLDELTGTGTVAVANEAPCDTIPRSEVDDIFEAPAEEVFESSGQSDIPVIDVPTIVSDSMILPDVILLQDESLELLIPPFQVALTDELGVDVLSFVEPITLEIVSPRILGAEESIYIFQPSEEGLLWYEVPFVVEDDVLRITISNPGQFFVWFLPKAALAAEEQLPIEAPTTPPIVLQLEKWIATLLSSTGILVGVGLLLLQLARAPFSVTHAHRTLAQGAQNLFALVTFRKKRHPWGTVYDSATKAPVDPAYVELFTLEGQKVAEAITDLDGRYGFLVAEGNYTMRVRKSNYTFPSKILSATGLDVIYSNLYFGGETHIHSTVVHDIPVDPAAFDWNQFEKMRTKQTKFFHTFDPMFVRLADFLFIIGLVAMVWQFIDAKTIYTSAFLFMYVVLLLLRFLTDRPILYGTLSKDGQPLSFAVVRVFENGRELITRVADTYGRYVAIVPPGTYQIVVEERLPDGVYAHVIETIVHAKHGVINSRLRV